MTYSVGDMVERTIKYSNPNIHEHEEALTYSDTIRGIVIDIDAAHMKVYWYHSGVTELYLHRMMKDVIKVVRE